MGQATLCYLQHRPRGAGAAAALRALCGVLRDFGDHEQLRAASPTKPPVAALWRNNRS